MDYWTYQPWNRTCLQRKETHSPQEMNSRPRHIPATGDPGAVNPDLVDHYFYNDQSYALSRDESGYEPRMNRTGAFRNMAHYNDRDDQYGNACEPLFSSQSMDTYSIREVDMMDFEPNRAPPPYSAHPCVPQTTGRLQSDPWHTEDMLNMPDAGLNSSMVPPPYQDLGYAVYNNNIPAYNNPHQMDMHSADVCYSTVTNMPPTPPDSSDGYSPKDPLEYYSLPTQSKESTRGYDAPQRSQQFISQDSRTSNSSVAMRTYRYKRSCFTAVRGTDTSTRAENRAGPAPRPLALAPQRRDSDNSHVSHTSQARSTTYETSQPRDHPHYRRGPDRDGNYRCPKELRCGHKPTKQKCNYE